MRADESFAHEPDVASAGTGPSNDYGPHYPRGDHGMWCGTCNFHRDQEWERRSMTEAAVDAYAYEHGTSFSEAFGRTDDGYDPVDA